MLDQVLFKHSTRAIADELKAWMEEHKEEKYLFSGNKGGALVNNSLNRWNKLLCAQAGIKIISSHGARHTSGNDYAQMGVEQKMIAKLFGHVNSATTERYTHIQVEQTKPLVEEIWGRLNSR